MVHFVAECWTGSLPLLKVTDWVDVKNVIFLNLHYGKCKIGLSGLDHYYFYETETGYTAGGWVDFTGRIGREYTFDKETLLKTKDLYQVPQIPDAKEGKLIPDECAKQLGLI